MIEDPPLTIRGSFARPAAEAVTALTGVPSGYLVDALGGHGALDYRIKPVTEGPPAAHAFCGVALTCDCGPADNLAVLAALEAVRPGDVIVAATDAFTGCAVVGDLASPIARIL